VGEEVSEEEAIASRKIATNVYLNRALKNANHVVIGV
jgi:hypothetical protein